MLRTSRLAGALVAVTLTLGLTVGSAGAATAPQRKAVPVRADKSGDWLRGQLTKGAVHNDQYGFDDYGLTADFGIALATIGGHPGAVRLIRQTLAKNVDSYTRGGTSDIYAGATAKLAVFARSAGVKPGSFGGVNLVHRIASRVSSQKYIVGRVQDKSAYGDYANVISQAYAAGALSAAHSPKAAAAVRFLLRQQCSRGYFRTYFADAASPRQACDGAQKASDKAPDTDVTAIALLNLMSIKRPNHAVKVAIRDGVRWLQRRQAANGSFVGGPSTTTPNANSTGLAAWTLGKAGKCTDARQAARWVAKVQRANGAVAYDRAAFGQPITKTTQDQWRRATAQAGPGLLFLRGC